MKNILKKQQVHSNTSPPADNATCDVMINDAKTKTKRDYIQSGRNNF